MLPDTGIMMVSDVVLYSKGTHTYVYNYETDEGSKRKSWEHNVKTLFQT